VSKKTWPRFALLRLNVTAFCVMLAFALATAKMTEAIAIADFRFLFIAVGFRPNYKLKVIDSR